MWTRGAARLWGAWGLTALAVGACTQPNPEFILTIGESGGQSSTATTDPSASLSDGSSSGSMTGSATDGTATAATVTDSTTVTTDPSTGSTSTTTGDSTSTGEPLDACGLGGFGEAEMYGRYTKNGALQPCADLQRNIQILAQEDGLIVGTPCSTEHGAGCTDCLMDDVFEFAVATPVPDEELGIGGCAYVSMQDPEEVDGEGLCRYNRTAVWHSDGNPTDEPPRIILGHTTLDVSDKVQEIEKVELSVTSKAVDAACGCVDADDCCEEKARDYELKLFEVDEVILGSGEAGPFEFSSVGYTAYNGGSYESGACETDLHLEWWVVRDP